MTRHQHSAKDLARALAARAAALAAELLPGGHRAGPEWVAGGIGGGKGRSLSMRLHGDRAGVWADFASGEAGDALDLVRLSLFAGDHARAMEWARGWLGLGDDRMAASAPPIRRAPAPASPAPDLEAAKNRKRALALFLEGAPLTGTCPASSYLEGRAIRLAELGRLPGALRFHPACWCAETGGPLPAMLAAVLDAQGGHLATHRTYLRQDSGAWRKASLANAKKVLGGFAGGFIPLWRGQSGKPLRDAPQGEHLVVAEGIESGLSCALLAPELRTIAAVSVANLARLALPATVTRITIATDGDAPGSPAAAALARAVEHFTAEGRWVLIACWDDGDANDALNAAEANTNV